MIKAIVVFIFVFFGALLTSGCSEFRVGELRIVGAWAQATVREYSENMSEHAYHMGVGDDAPLYLRIINNGVQPERLLRASSEVSEGVEIRTINPDAVIIPAEGRVDFSLGAENQFILKNINQDLFAGRKITVMFEFENAGSVIVEIPVKLPRN